MIYCKDTIFSSNLLEGILYIRHIFRHMISSAIILR